MTIKLIKVINITTDQNCQKSNMHIIWDPKLFHKLSICLLLRSRRWPGEEDSSKERAKWEPPTERGVASLVLSLLDTTTTHAPSSPSEPQRCTVGMCEQHLKNSARETSLGRYVRENGPKETGWPRHYGTCSYSAPHIYEVQIVALCPLYLVMCLLQQSHGPTIVHDAPPTTVGPLPETRGHPSR